jgi:hypothetical protein
VFSENPGFASDVRAMQWSEALNLFSVANDRSLVNHF